MIRYTFRSHFLQRSFYICRTYKFLTSYFSHCAVWILCVISLERAAVTKRCVWKRNVFGRKHSYCTLLAIFLLLFVLNSHYLIFFGSKHDGWSANATGEQVSVMCASNLVRRSKQTYEYFLIYYFSWMDFVINSLVPFLIILIANTSVMYSVCKTRLGMKQLGMRQTRSPRDTQLAYILFVSTFLFLLLTFPLRVFSVIEPYLKYEQKYLILLDGIMRFLLYLDHGCGFYLYTFTGELFRRELRKFIYHCLFKLCHRRYSRWTHVEMRRFSELSCSNGAPAGSYAVHSQTHPPNIHLRDSISSCIGSNVVPGTSVRLSVYSLRTQKSSQHPSYHRCACAKSYLPNTLSTSSTRSRLSPATKEDNPLRVQERHALVKRHSSSCFEAQYPPLTALPIVESRKIAVDHDRNSDIV